MRLAILAAALLCAACGTLTPPPPLTSQAPSPSVTVDTTPAPAPAPTASLGLSLPALTGNVVADIKSLLTWLGQQSQDDLIAARDIAANATPPDLAGALCHGWAAKTVSSLPAIGSGGAPFGDIKGPISAFEKARVLLQNGLTGSGGTTGILEQFNINCSPYIQSINYRAGKGALLAAGTATTGVAAAPGFGAVQELLNAAPKLFGL